MEEVRDTEETNGDKYGIIIKILISLILLVILIVLIMAAIFLYSMFFNTSYNLPDLPEIPDNSCFEFDNGEIICPENNSTLPNNLTIKINETIIGHILYALEIHQLHKSPISQDTPKIEMIIQEENFNSEIISHEIYTKKGTINNEDAILFMENQVFIDIITSDSIKDSVISATQDGLILVKPIADYSTLLSKGYYELYKRMEPTPGDDESGGSNSGVVYHDKSEFVKLEFA